MPGQPSDLLSKVSTSKAADRKKRIKKPAGASHQAILVTFDQLILCYYLCLPEHPWGGLISSANTQCKKKSTNGNQRQRVGLMNAETWDGGEGERESDERGILTRGREKRRKSPQTLC